MTQESHSHNPRSRTFRDLDILKDASGVKAVISQRVSSGVITFSLLREFELDGAKETTGFFPETMLDEVEAMLGLVRRRIGELKAQTAEVHNPPPVKNANGGVRRLVR